MTDTRDSFEKVAEEIRKEANFRLNMQGDTKHSRDMLSWADRLTALQAGAGGAQAVPAGWALVPIEPNWDMRNEGREFLIDGLEKDYEKIAYFLWKTMVNASPKAPHG